MEFRILGPLEVVDGERSVPLGGAKQRSVLGLLLVARGRTVTTDALIDEIWNGRAPETARKSVQTYVSGLREVLGKDRIHTFDGAYALRLEPGELDADRFEELVREASADGPVAASRRLGNALGLVRGAPFEDLQTEPWASRESAPLEELVLAAREARIDAELELGEHRRLIAELERLVAEHPYREHLLEQLMLALYRSGRQAEALDAFRRGTMRLRTDVGLDAGPTLRRLEQAILNHDPSLEPRELPEPNGVGAKRRRSPIGIAVVLIAAAAAATAGLLATRGTPTRFEQLEPSIVLLDMEREKVIAQWPYRQFQYPWAFTGNGHFWLASTTAAGTEIDPRTGRFLRQFFPPLATGTNLALPRGRSLWFTTVAGLIRYDLGIDQETARYPIVKGPHPFGLNGIAFAAGAIWVTSPEEDAVFRIDPHSGFVEARIPVRRPWWLSSGNGGIWVSSDVDGIERIDAATNSIATSAPVPNPIDEVRVGGGYAWATNSPKGTVYKVDQSGRIVGTYQTGEGAHEPSFSGGKLWVSNQYAGTLTSIDSATGETRTYRFGHLLGTEAAIGRYVLLAITEGRTVDDVLASTHGKVAKLIVPTFQFDPPDPPRNSNPFIFEVERATCAELVRFSPTTGSLEPDLAREMPAVSRDGRTYTFTLRRGLHFAPPSGAPVTARAVRHSIERALSPKLGTPRPAAEYLRDLARLRVNGNRITLTIRAPSPDFLERLALPYYCTVPADTPAVNGSTIAPNAPPSAGPYYMAERWNGAWTLLKRNPNYRGPHPARLDAIVLREDLDAERAVEKVTEGEWHGLSLDDPLLRPGGVVARRYATGPVRYVALPRARLEYVALNAGRGALRDPALRRLVAAALDRAALAAQNALTPTAGLLPPAVRRGSVETPESPQQQEPVETTRLRIAIDRACGRSCAALADQVAAALEPVGIDVTPVSVQSVPAAMRTSRVDMAMLATDLPYPDPASFLTQMLGHDVPVAWLPRPVRPAVARLTSLSGPRRDRAAVSLARRLERMEMPVIAYGTPQNGMLAGRELGCRRQDAFDAELDLTALCMR